MSDIESSRSEPQAVATQQLARYGNPYPKGDVRYADSFDESLQGIATLQLDDVRAFHAISTAHRTRWSPRSAISTRRR